MSSSRASDQEDGDATSRNRNIRIVSWNILANRCLKYHPYVSFLPNERNLLLRNILEQFTRSPRFDFICLQEVDVEVVCQTLREASYEGLSTPTGDGYYDGGRVDACWIFYNNIDWKLIKHKVVDMDDLATLGFPHLKTGYSEFQDYSNSDFQHIFKRNNYGILAKLENRSNGKQVVISNTHLYWDPAFDFVKLCQSHYLALNIKQFVSDDPNVPVVFCGDLNSMPGTTVHSYLTKGKVDRVSVGVPSYELTPELQRLSVYKWLYEGDRFLICPFHFQSSYALRDDTGKIVGENAPFTNKTQTFEGFLDYILFQPSHFQPVARLPLPGSLDDLRENYGGICLPSHGWPSDHVAVGSELCFCNENDSGSRVETDQISSTRSWIGNEHLVTRDNCEAFGMNDYLFDKYGMAMGLDHWWDDVEDSDA